MKALQKHKFTKLATPMRKSVKDVWNCKEEASSIVADKGRGEGNHASRKPPKMQKTSNSMNKQSQETQKLQGEQELNINKSKI